MHAISSYRGNRPTNTPINTQTRRQDRLQYTAPQLARSVTTKYYYYYFPLLFIGLFLTDSG